MSVAERSELDWSFREGLSEEVTFILSPEIWVGVAGNSWHKGLSSRGNSMFKGTVAGNVVGYFGH